MGSGRIHPCNIEDRGLHDKGASVNERPRVSQKREDDTNLKPPRSRGSKDGRVTPMSGEQVLPSFTAKRGISQEIFPSLPALSKIASGTAGRECSYTTQTSMQGKRKLAEVD